jgi:site-specific DNA recombinase
MFERYVEGIGSSIIAKEPTAKRIKVPKGGTKWRESTIRGILKN